MTILADPLNDKEYQDYLAAMAQSHVELETIFNKERTLRDYIHKIDEKYDAIDPPHYKQFKFEPWKVIGDWDLNYLVGSAVKYIARHEKKGNPEQDLRKAIRFLEMELERRADLP